MCAMTCDRLHNTVVQNISQRRSFPSAERAFLEDVSPFSARGKEKWEALTVASLPHKQLKFAKLFYAVWRNLCFTG